MNDPEWLRVVERAKTRGVHEEFVVGGKTRTMSNMRPSAQATITLWNAGFQQGGKDTRKEFHDYGSLLLELARLQDGGEW